MNGSFADMILLPSVGSAGSKHKSGLAMLTNPGQLHLYGNGSLSLISSQPEKQTSIFVEKFSGVVPMVDPIMTVAKLVALPPGGNSSKVLHEVATARKNGATPAQVGGLKWPLTGGVPSQLAFAEHATVERVYVAGYEDGSVRLWNATYLVLSLIYILECKMQNLDIASFSAPVSNLEFCSHSLRLAVGNIHGLVRIYNLNGSSHGKNICILTETKNEVHSLPEGEESLCSAVISLVCSPIHALQFANSGAKLVVGFECGRVAVLDMTSPSVLFFTDSVSPSSTPVIAVSLIKYVNTPSVVRSPKHSEPNIPSNSKEEIMLLLSRDATITIFNSDSGGLISSHQFHPGKKSIAISIGKLTSFWLKLWKAARGFWAGCCC
uniref:Uncharacterized protein LOC105111170 isoform X1 n=1 Tax=Rhizophora mucronata TaxID=61149 RepID=A0A2P2M1C2_RHIMU